MPKRFTKPQIRWMQDQRRLGRAYSQIANDFPEEFLGEKKPSESAVYNHTSKVQILIEEPIKEEPFDYEVEETTPPKPVSEETKKQETEILNKFIEGKSLTDILKEHHHSIVFRMRKVYEKNVLGDKIKNWEDRLRFLGVWDENAEDPVQDGIWRLSDEADKANRELADLESRVEQEKNEIFQEYREKQEEDKETVVGLQKELRERNLREKQWNKHVNRLNIKHEKEIKRWQQYVRDILYSKVKYDEVMNFAKATDPLVEAYRKVQFNTITRLYELPLTVRRQFDTKLARTVRSKDWKGYMNVVVDLIKKIDPNAEQWIKRESVIVASSKNTARLELYKQLVNLGFTGTLKDFKEVLEKHRTKPQLQREVQVLEKRIATLKPKVKELEFKQKVLKTVIPELQEYKEKALTRFSKVCNSTDKLIKNLEEYNTPKSLATAKELKKTMIETVATVEKLFPPSSGRRQTLSEYLSSRRHD